MIINSSFGSALDRMAASTACRQYLSAFLLCHFFLPPVPVGVGKNYPEYQRGGAARRTSLPIQRVLITCVLSQAQPGHPRWIKREIVSCCLIFHHLEMFPCPQTSNCCGTEIIQTHSRLWNPSFSGCWTASPWNLWGHQWPNKAKAKQIELFLMPKAKDAYNWNFN